MSHAPSEATMAEITKLIGFDTTSRDSNLPLIDYVVERLEALGIESTLVHNAEGDKANLLGHDPGGRRHPHRRHRALRAHRRGPRRRTGMEQRPVQPGDPRRQALCPRGLRYEGLRRGDHGQA